MTTTENPKSVAGQAVGPRTMGSGFDSANEGYVCAVSADGVEVMFKAAKADRHFDPTRNEHILQFAESFARSCSEKQEFPSTSSLLEIARRTQYRLLAHKNRKAKSLVKSRKIAEGFAAIGCLVLAYALALGIDRRLNEQKHIAVVASESVDIGAPKTGNVIFILPPGLVRKGDAVAGVRTAAGDEFVIEAPCDCMLASAFSKPGDGVFKDKTLLRFWQSGTREFVSLRMPMAQALRLKSGASVSVKTITSGEQRQFEVAGSSVNIQSLPPGASKRSTGDVAVRIYPPYPLKLAAGEIVAARLRSPQVFTSPSVALAKDGF